LAGGDEIRGVRDIPKLQKTDTGVTGSINQELYYSGVVKALLRYGIGGGAFTSADLSVAASAACSVDVSAYEYSIDTGTWANTPAVGDYVEISGFTATTFNGRFRVIASTSSTFTVWSDITKVRGDDTPTDTADESGSTATIDIMSSTSSGATVNSMSIQKNFSDLTSKVLTYTGVVIEGFSIEASGQDPLSFNIDLIGQDEVTTESYNALTAEISTNSSIVPTTGIAGVREGRFVVGGSSYLDYAATQFSINVSNNYRKQYELGTFGAKEFKFGDLVVTGTLQAYFADYDVYDKFIAQTPTGLMFEVTDESTTGVAGTNNLIFDFPSVKITDATVVAGGRNQDVIADISWQALYSTDTSDTMSIISS
jgi:hypothetical protein